jgi:CheY-like chemotaxis protein
MHCDILHIDDNAQDLELTEMALREVGHAGEYSGQTDPLGGLRALSRHAIPMPHLIVLDLNMPRMNGFEFIEATTRDPRLRDCRIVVLTTSSSEKDVERCLRLGAVAVLTKPNDYADLIEIARRIVELC